VEEQFYLAWPSVVRVASRRGLALVCVALILIALTARFVVRGLDLERDLVSDLAYTWTICRVDALALGALAAIALRSPTWSRRLGAMQGTLLAAAVVLFAGGAVTTNAYIGKGTGTQTFGYTILGLCGALVLILGVLVQARGTRLARILAPAPLRSFGKYSYGMYVFHVMLHHGVGVPVLGRLGIESRTMGVTIAYALVMTGLTYVAAVISYHLWEHRFLALKRHFPVARGAGA